MTNEEIMRKFMKQNLTIRDGRFYATEAAAWKLAEIFAEYGIFVKISVKDGRFKVEETPILAFYGDGKSDHNSS